MQFEKTDIEGIWVITPKVFEDQRGYFMETFIRKAFETYVGPVDFVQENESLSRFGVTRGLHFQKEPYAQSKLIRVVKGRIFDVAVDIRPDSPTCGRHFCIELSDVNKKQLFIPGGFAHGFCVQSREALVQYKTDVPYTPGAEGAYRYDSPALEIRWPLSQEKMILSAKDMAAPLFSY